MFVSIPGHLAERFRAGRKYLVCTQRQCFIAEGGATFFDADGQPAAIPNSVVVDLSELWVKFARIIGERSAFNEQELATVANVDADLVRLWTAGSVIATVGGVYGPHDAFAAALCGSLRRNGVPIRVAHNAAKFVRTGDGADTSGDRSKKKRGAKA